ncbi:ABC transporter substrate-binding protein [Carnobacterium antarcticum]|uniref:ABC transporter substrate-binding protein n=1 Tax=Carnobacterium antarcticum TaxID=2126436 RepID=A0ABW4NPY6_9LACT|nr:ABC transporter substrate-binding protein [Carnobacterium sp. CP1]ALV21418.1 Multiple sugar ABC transporter, substrate-binding protein [Carnobacterium sp. CP1]
MKINFKKTLVKGAVALLCGAALVGCGRLAAGDSKESENKNSGGDKDTVLMYQVGVAPENLDELMEIANKRIEDEVGVRLKIQYIGWGDYEKKMNVITSSGENYDIAFAQDYLNNAQKGAYADLTELAQKYAPETMEQIDEAYITGNTIDGKLYAIPVNANVYAQQMFTFNPTFLDKYDMNISKVETLEDLEPFLQTVKDNESGVVPLTAGSGWRIEKDLDYLIGNNVPLGIDLNGDPKKLINPYEEGDSLLPLLDTMHDYYTKGFVPADAATSQTAYNTDEDTWFVRQETQGPYDYGDYLLQRITGKEITSRPFSKAAKTVAQARMANFVISNNSKKKEESMKVLNLLNSDPELLNGLVYGVEGRNWEKTDEEGRIRLLDGYSDPKSGYMSAWNLANNAILYIDEKVTDEQIEHRDKSIEEAEESPLLGFNFVTDNVKTEITNVNNVAAQYTAGLQTGSVDPKKVVPEYLEKLKEAGLDKIQEEAQKQFDEFNANK